MATEMSALLEVQNVSRIYGEDGVATPALVDASFTVSKGQFISIMGASGSGKSTLLHILGLLDRPTYGKFLLEGQDTANLTDAERAHIRNKKIGFVFQTFHLLARTSVLENVMLPLQYSAVPRTQHEQKARAALKKVEMDHRLTHTPAQLSGGEKQRTVIARALVTEPHVLLADEPTGNLDTRTGEIVMQLIDGLHKQGLTIIVITHESSAARYAQRILTLSDGRIKSDKHVKNHQHQFNK